MLRKYPVNTNALFIELGRIVSHSGLIVYPTETLYALGASANDKIAISKLYRLKHRPSSWPLSIALNKVDDIELYAVTTKVSETLADRFLPGPLTLILKNRGKLKGIKGKTIGIRIPAHPIALKLVEHCGPLTVTSANAHGMKEPVDVKTAKTQLKDNIDVYIDSGCCRIGKGSTIIDLSGRRPILVRKGAISSTALEEYYHAT
jgi:L-threonylcarbamoyladenylate synthase